MKCCRSSCDTDGPDSDDDLGVPDGLVASRPRRVRPDQRDGRGGDEQHAARRLGVHETPDGNGSTRRTGFGAPAGRLSPDGTICWPRTSGMGAPSAIDKMPTRLPGAPGPPYPKGGSRFGVRKRAVTRQPLVHRWNGPRKTIGTWGARWTTSPTAGRERRPCALPVRQSFYGRYTTDHRLAPLVTFLVVLIASVVLAITRTTVSGNCSGLLQLNAVRGGRRCRCYRVHERRDCVHRTR